MARVFTLSFANEEIQTILARSFQSAHINFLIGAGASYPAIPIAGTVEKEIATLFQNGQEQEAQHRIYEFLSSVQGPTNDLIGGAANADNDQSIQNYSNYLGTIETILAERRTSLLPKQAAIFSTNYDLLVEKAALTYPAFRLNDGFSRVPSLDGRMEYSTRTFFTSTSNSGNLYNYKVEIPSVNLIKLHGSLSWKKDADNILFSVQKRELLPGNPTPEQIKSFIEAYAVVLPQITKFRTTLMESTYYELLRIYANALDRENSLLVAFGFSFGDEHILGITKRGLKNPTLKLVAFAFNDADRKNFMRLFDGYNNVDIVAPEADSEVDFKAFNSTLTGCLPSFGPKQ